MSRQTLEEERNQALLGWYQEHGRTLPWRTAADPYPILVAEVMSQQTQVARVVPTYQAFMARFPTVDALAGAPLREVLAAWSGLGYNSRAERLHRAAKLIAAGGWPQDPAGLEQLPGVGSYTARAVAAFAFGAQVPAVDTNLKRVLSRWHGEPLDGTSLEHAAVHAMATADASAWNQAVMDLGAGVCRPRAPECHVCPVEPWCAGPEVYEPPRPQPRFEGSMRQIRGAVIRTLVREPATIDELAAWIGAAPSTVEDAVYQLSQDGLVEWDGTRYRLPE